MSVFLFDRIFCYRTVLRGPPYQIVSVVQTRVKPVVQVLDHVFLGDVISLKVCRKRNDHGLTCQGSVTHSFPAPSGTPYGAWDRDSWHRATLQCPAASGVCVRTGTHP